jgi:ribosomal protein S18 acetylase RimI-like enzyme
MITYRDALLADGPALSHMAKRSFTATFGTLYRAEDLASFLDATFSERLPSHLADPDFAVRIALDGEKVAGFAKIGPVDFPGEWGPETVELHQLYLLGEYQGEGLAQVLMDWILDTARARGFSRIVLSVFVDNHRARRFYEKYGFTEIGKYEFRVGDHVDDDRIMARDL